jgi:hypothetical protein
MQASSLTLAPIDGGGINPPRAMVNIPRGGGVPKCPRLLPSAKKHVNRNLIVMVEPKKL